MQTYGLVTTDGDGKGATCRRFLHQWFEFDSSKKWFFTCQISLQILFWQKTFENLNSLRVTNVFLLLFVSQYFFIPCSGFFLLFSSKRTGLEFLFFLYLNNQMFFLRLWKHKNRKGPFPCQTKIFMRKIITFFLSP